MLSRTAALLAGTAVSCLALAGLAAPAQAATTTWKVANPNADGTFTAASGALTVKNQSGKAVLTCGSGTSQGELASRTGTSTNLGRFLASRFDSCVSADGTAWTGWQHSSQFPNHFAANGHDAATGTTALTHDGVGNYVFTTNGSNECGFLVGSTAMTYSNATSTLKSTTGKVTLFEADGVPTCQGLLTNGETITFATEYRITPAVQITATTG